MWNSKWNRSTGPIHHFSGLDWIMTFQITKFKWKYLNDSTAKCYAQQQTHSTHISNPKKNKFSCFFSSSSSPERDEAAVVSFSKSRSHEIVFFFTTSFVVIDPKTSGAAAAVFCFFFFSAHKQQQQQTEKVERILFNSRFVIYNY